MLNRHSGGRRQCDREALVLVGELVGSPLVAEVQVPEYLVSHEHGDTEERVHVGMVRGEAVGLLVGAEIAQAQRSWVDDEKAEDPATLGKMADGGIALGVD